MSRVPLGLLFWLVAGNRYWEISVLAVAALTDVLDGWVARRYGNVEPPQAARRRPNRGDWLDPLCDKLFAAAVVTGLLATRPIPILLVLLFLTREILQVIAVTVMHVVPALQRAARDYDFRAHPVGKAATVAQFATAALMVVDHRWAWGMAFVCATVGVASVFIYVNRIRGLLGAPTARRVRTG